MKIAVIDTGIDKKFRDFAKAHISGINIKNYKDDINDQNGHGTASVGEILRINSEADIIMIKALDRYGKTSLLSIIDALEYCLKLEEIKIISLSLACEIIEQEVLEYFEILINRLADAGKIIVSSIDNNYKYDKERYGYPAKFENVIGVRHQYDKNYHIMFNESLNQYTVCSSFYMMPFINNQYYFYKGNSCAVPQICGILSKFKGNNITEILQDYKEKKDLQVGESYSKLKKTIKNYCKREYGEAEYIKIQSEECLALLRHIELVYNIVLDYKKFSIEDFVNVTRLAKKCSIYI